MIGPYNLYDPNGRYVGADGKIVATPFISNHCCPVDALVTIDN
jgi:hypothetical protein